MALSTTSKKGFRRQHFVQTIEAEAVQEGRHALLADTIRRTAIWPWGPFEIDEGSIAIETDELRLENHLDQSPSWSMEKVWPPGQEKNSYCRAIGAASTFNPGLSGIFLGRGHAFGPGARRAAPLGRQLASSLYRP
jgi:hypothetical protein